MTKLLFVAITCIFLNSHEQHSKAHRAQIPAPVAMQNEKSKDNLCIDCLKTTYGDPIQCNRAECCCTLCCCPCWCIVGFGVTLKNRYKS